MKEDEMGKACSTYGDMINAYRMLVGKPEGKKPLGRPRRRWKDNIKMDLKKQVDRVCIRFIWLRIGTGDGLL
jgi:hypothetical protein